MNLGQVVGGAPIGIGTRGPGEQQLEIDRRLVQRRRRQLQRELEGIQQRKTREVEQRRLDHYTVGLVGYTNAGKSTLFNQLTNPDLPAPVGIFRSIKKMCYESALMDQVKAGKEKFGENPDLQALLEAGDTWEVQ